MVSSNRQTNVQLTYFRSSFESNTFILDDDTFEGIRGGGATSLSPLPTAVLALGAHPLVLANLRPTTVLANRSTPAVDAKAGTSTVLALGAQPQVPAYL